MDTENGNEIVRFELCITVDQLRTLAAACESLARKHHESLIDCHIGSEELIFEKFKLAKTMMQLMDNICMSKLGGDEF